jgi:MFS family permease
MIAALRYARASDPLKRTLLRAFLFFSFASAPWALLPLFVRVDLGGTAAFYGIMLGAIGAGAVGGAIVMPLARRRLSTDRLVLAATILISVAGLGMAATGLKAVALWLMPILGLGWIMVLTILNVTAQSILPNWVRGRGLAIYLTVFFGGMAFGGLLWGQVAEFTSTRSVLAMSAGLGLMTALFATRLPLPSGTDDLTPSMHWPEPAIEGVANDSGPVMVMIEYRVAQPDVAEFSTAIEALGTTRRRDGAYAWGVFQDTDSPERFVEYFIVESWIEHLRQHRRVSKADALLQAAVKAHHEGPDPPKVSHLIALGQMAALHYPRPNDQRDHDI